MSKLDSGLFVMTPVDIQVELIGRNVVKMFKGEAKAAGIDLEFRIEDSCKEMDIVTVSLDPTRVTQILIVRIVFCSVVFAANQQCRTLSPTRSSLLASRKRVALWLAWVYR
jgi:hypothetical protein